MLESFMENFYTYIFLNINYKYINKIYFGLCELILVKFFFNIN